MHTDGPQLRMVLLMIFGLHSGMKVKYSSRKCTSNFSIFRVSEIIVSRDPVQQKPVMKSNQYFTV